ncbi:E3 ubiquitin-protein ligase TRIM33-like [Dendronephthya gigantea]|uniref:E3 ubiquitin-protein ligase TRIM33-like n=1 Tax=Dendronephthya gigantea TaxID=151771 RepID=UPI00106CBF86|nr:E3 ubiquitin-protein ligase TRIM33-like [Dendronephthya gigantea]
MATLPDPAPAKQIEELLSCCICKGTLDKPKSLPCFHSFCRKCLAKYIEVQREKAQKERRVQHSFDCPTCRTKFQLRQGDSVERIPPNYFINNLLEILPVIQQQTRKIHCESCKVAEASVTHRCIECERYLCKNCLTTHNNWPDFKQHDVMTLAELSKPENQGKARGKPRCEKEGHGNKPLVFYCNTCQELACINCVVLNHSKANHDYHPIETVAKHHKKALEITSANLQRVSNEVKAALQKIKQATKNLQVNTKRAKDTILQQEKVILEELTQKVKHNTEILLGEVDRANNIVNQQLGQQRNEMKNYLEKVNGSLDFAKNIIEKASNDEIVLLSPEIQINAKDIKKEGPEMMEPIHDGSMKYQAKSSETIVGKMKLDKLGNFACGPLRRNIALDIVARSTILERNIEHAKQLVEWMEDKKFNWQLCYRASRDGWGADDFHRKCDDVGPTVTLVKYGTNIFGGFTDQSWKQTTHSAYGEYKHSYSSFLFSLKNKENMRPFKCPIKDGENDRAISCHRDWGAVFGGGNDLFISTHANICQSSYSKLGDTYQPPPGYKPGAPETRALLAGSCKLTPSEIEVFHS